ncbi:MAG: phosphoribosyltransferase [Verrucomicrobia bacterium]|nr:phosphoribosyltransferase [Verrucomicrobiota bacterium]
MAIDRYPWRGFPAVWIHAEELAVKRHLDYAAAKAGDSNAAFRLVISWVAKHIVDALRQTFDDCKPTLVSAHAIEREGVNAIPEALAEHLGSQLTWPVDSEIVQTNVVGHTGADGFTRLALQAEFGGTIEAGRTYLLVDDFIGQGGTLANLRGFVLKGGGEVVGATVLTGKPYSAILTPHEESL